MVRMVLRAGAYTPTFTGSYFSTGELVRPILASAAIPGVFTLVEIGKDWYIGGGTMNNFPVEPLRG